MITLWGRLNSANVQKAAWALEELGLVYDHVALGGAFGGNKEPGDLAMNPNGLVPTLRDGDLVIWESHAILRYLAAEYGPGTLFPTSPLDRAIADQWTDWTATTFQPAWIQLFWLKVRTPLERQDPGDIDKALVATNRCFAMLDVWLRQSLWLGGESFTYADIAAGVAMFRWSTMEIARPVLPGVERWHAALNQRTAFRGAVNVSYEELRGRLSF